MKTKLKIKFFHFNKKNLISVETKVYGLKHITTKVYTFKCNNAECNKTLRVQWGHLSRRSNLCASCSAKRTRLKVIQKHQLRPFEARYRRFLNKAKEGNKINNLTYEDFLLFTHIGQCHYCGCPIDWRVKHAYNLDRIDDALPYSTQNCVVCCGLCNFTKRNVFSYGEFTKIGKVIKEIRLEREQCQN